MPPIRLRLSEFCKLAGGDNKQTVRSIIARDEAPFAYESQDGGQRTYDAGDLLAWCLFTQLRNLGLSAADAAETVRGSTAVALIFEAEARGEDMADLFLVFERAEKLSPSGDARTVLGRFLWTSGEIADRLRVGAAHFGKMNPSGDIRLGLSGLTVVPVLPCIERSRLALQRAGFVAKGADLFEVEA